MLSSILILYIFNILVFVYINFVYKFDKVQYFIQWKSKNLPVYTP